jgi:NTP pyrophosphatase (non-canonical NTP hydrolase)
MDADEYLLEAMNFASPKSDLCCAALGLCGEAGEFADLVKKMFYQDHDLDYEKAVKEVGDVQWYVALACQQLGISMAEMMEQNINKLRERYPSGAFEPERSKNREA